jgi:DNA-binding NarL/FixJ family response regulator
VSTGGFLNTAPEVIELLRLSIRSRSEPRVAVRGAELSPREVDLLVRLAMGASDGEIADRLQETTEAVRSQTATILSNLEVNSRLQALAVASECGAITIE